MKSVKNLDNLKNQVSKFNQKTIVGGVYPLILSAQPADSQSARLASGLRVNS